jgi:hypothetical protein
MPYLLRCTAALMLLLARLRRNPQRLTRFDRICENSTGKRAPTPIKWAKGVAA